MKYLLHRMTALLLALLLLCSAGGVFAFASQKALPDPACALGTDPADMLAGGGRFVRTERGTYYVNEEDGDVYLLGKDQKLVLEGPAAKLNYADGRLYFARLREDGSFDLCAYDLDRGFEQLLLARFFGKLGQLYLVDGKYLDFSCDNAVWQLELETGSYRLIHYARDLWSFVPTASGLLCAVGTMFDCSLYANDLLLAEHVSDYTVETDRNSWLVVYTREGANYQAELAEAFAGTAVPIAYQGRGTNYVALKAAAELSPEEAVQAEEAEMERIQTELADILARPENQIRNAEFITGATESVLPQLIRSGLKPDVIVLDPPRKGCDPAVLNAIQEASPERIVYVSCSAPTLARDVEILSRHGYSVKAVQSVDMFCWTSSIETCCLLERL